MVEEMGKKGGINEEPVKGERKGRQIAVKDKSFPS